MTQPKLNDYLRKVRAVFDINEVVNQGFDAGKIVEYYTQSNLGYQFFHSNEGSVHMALNYDGKFSKDGYFGQAKLAETQLRAIGANRVLELASGKGFNLIYLAKRNPSVSFVGIDLTPVHVNAANAHADESGLQNIKFLVGDFHNLEFPNESFDYVFEVESICHAIDMKLVLETVNKLLRTGGLFTVIDGFKKKSLQLLSEDERLAALLVEKSMAVGGALLISEFKKNAESVGFETKEINDISYAIMPNLIRLQVLARGFFKFPLVAKLAYKLLPPYLVKNAIAGLLMPIVVQEQIQGYFVGTFSK